MTMIEYAKTFLGTPYVWGGNTAEQGLDCSGLVCEILRVENLILNNEDLTAQQIYVKFSSLNYSSGTGKNTLVFYGESNNKITHVAFGIGDDKIIESAGEGRSNTDKGFVRVRKVNYRNDLVASIKLRF